MRRIVMACLGLAVLMAAVAACGGSSAGGSAAPKGTTSATTSPTSGGSVDALVSLALTSSEASSAGRIPVLQALAPQGDLVGIGNESTLDLCNKTFPSETLRLARHQVIYNDQRHSGRVDESNEIVRYKPGGAAQAYSEIQSAAHSCPAMTQNKIATSKVVVRPRDPRLVSQQLTVTYSITANAHTTYSAAVYQYVGDLFSGVYVYRATAKQALTSALALAALSAKKLQDAPA